MVGSGLLGCLRRCCPHLACKTMTPTSDRNRAREGMYRETLTISKGFIDSYRHNLSIKPLGMVSAAL
jgi:hypothetical protein